MMEGGVEEHDREPGIVFDETGGVPTSASHDRDVTAPISIDETPMGTGNLPYVGSIPPGTLIQGCYRVLGLLGEGGMGLVLHGVDEKLEREVAIKFIHPKHIDTDELRELFMREARAMARVRHPNLVEIYAYGEFDGAPYFVMEYVKGRRLDNWVNSHQDGRVSVDEALGVLDQLCRGVAALHTAGAIHRDLKPTNVLLGPGFRVVITDMGLAGHRAEGTEGDEAAIAGTPAYLAPEVITQREVPRELAHSADIYALGVMAYELLTGRLPFPGKSPLAQMQAHVYDTAPAPSTVAPTLPEAFDRVLARALAKDPRLRVPSADALRTSLAAARESLSQPTAMRILIADDEPASLRWMAKFVNVSFANVTLDLVPDGTTALRHAIRNPPTIALIDLSMPGLNGVELTAALKANARTKDVPIVVVTGVGGATDWRLLHQLGAAGFLVKPVDPEALNASIRRLAGQAATR